jgi:Cu2+-exporting ATPase
MAMMLGLRLPDFVGQAPLLTLLASVAVFYGGWPFFASSAQSLRRGRLDMNVLVSLALLVGFAFSLYATFAGLEMDFYEAVSTLVVFILAGHVLEARAYARTQDAVGAVLRLVPARARRRQVDGSLEEVATDQLHPGDVIVIRPGEAVPADATIVEGETAVDESVLTGESLPVPKSPGQAVIGGSINASGLIAAKVTRIGSDSFVAQLVRLVGEAQQSKPKAQRMADRLAHYLTLTAIVVGTLTLAYWWIVAGKEPSFAVSLATSVIIITCPHALGLAMPVVVAVATGVAARIGVVIKGAGVLEGLAAATVVILDKTGTLTEGRLAVTDVISFAPTVASNELVAVAAAAQSGSTHGISAAFGSWVADRQITLPQVIDFALAPGRGVSASVDGQLVVVGNRQHMANHGINLVQADGVEQRMAAEGKTVSYVGRQGKLLGAIGLADLLKPDAVRTVAELKLMRLKVLMVTGDNDLVARAFAAQLSLEYLAEVLPGDKRSVVTDLQSQGHRVVMVGDGINDAAALAAADVGIALGSGTDIAVNSADVVLVRSNPRDVVSAIRIARSAVSKMRQNLIWAVSYNVLAIPLAAGLLYQSLGLLVPPGISALVMSASSIIVVVNALTMQVPET